MKRFQIDLKSPKDSSAASTLIAKNTIPQGYCRLYGCEQAATKFRKRIYELWCWIRYDQYAYYAIADYGEALRRDPTDVDTMKTVAWCIKSSAIILRDMPYYSEAIRLDSQRVNSFPNRVSSLLPQD